MRTRLTAFFSYRYKKLSQNEDKQKLIDAMENAFGDNAIIETTISPFGSTKI